MKRRSRPSRVVVATRRAKRRIRAAAILATRRIDVAVGDAVEVSNAGPLGVGTVRGVVTEITRDPDFPIEVWFSGVDFDVFDDFAAHRVTRVAS